MIHAVGNRIGADVPGVAAVLHDLDAGVLGGQLEILHLQGQRILLQLVEIARQRGQVTDGIDPALEGPVIFVGLFPERLDGPEGNAALPDPG